jgi:hypothetical protein
VRFLAALGGEIDAETATGKGTVVSRQGDAQTLAITHIFDRLQGGYSCGFDLRLDPTRLGHVGALKRLSTEEHDREGSQQTIDATGKDVGNCKAQTTLTLKATGVAQHVWMDRSFTRRGCR